MIRLVVPTVRVRLKRISTSGKKKEKETEREEPKDIIMSLF